MEDEEERISNMAHGEFYLKSVSVGTHNPQVHSSDIGTDLALLGISGGSILLAIVIPVVIIGIGSVVAGYGWTKGVKLANK